MRYRFLTAILAMIPLGACGAASGVDTNPAPPPSSLCEAGAAQHFVGQKVTGAIGQQVLNATGARTLRWGPPHSAWTADFRSDRVNISYDDANIIEQISCG